MATTTPATDDLYAVLGVPSYATSAEVAAAYRKLARVHHPDAGGDAAAFARLAAAYEVLSNPARRSAYDAQRNAERERLWDRERDHVWQHEYAYDTFTGAKPEKPRPPEPSPEMVMFIKASDRVGPVLTRILPMWAWITLILAIGVAPMVQAFALEAIGGTYDWLSHAYYVGAAVPYGAVFVVAVATARYLADLLHDRFMGKSKDLVR